MMRSSALVDKLELLAALSDASGSLCVWRIDSHCAQSIFLFVRGALFSASGTMRGRRDVSLLICVWRFFLPNPPLFNLLCVVDIVLHIAGLFKKKNRSRLTAIQYILRGKPLCGRGLTTARLGGAYSSVAACGGACESWAEYFSTYLSPPLYACLCARGSVCDVCLRICAQKVHVCGE